MANIREVAKAAGVSPSTVSRALRGAVPVSEDARQRVVRAAAQLQYKSPEPAAAEEYQFGIIIPRFSADDLPQHPTLYTNITGFVTELDKRKIRNSMLVIDDPQIKNIESLFAETLDGYLILGTSQEQEDILLPFLDTLGRPYVLQNRWIQERHVNYVNIDDVWASMTATGHLLSLEHRKIAFVGGNENFRNSKLRLLGFTRACEQAGVTPPGEYIIQDKYTETSGYEAAGKLLSLKAPPSAAFFTSDVLAIGFQRALHERNMNLPEDFAMVSYGDIELARYVSPRLTTIRMPSEEMGRQAAAALLNLIRNPSVASVQILMKASLVIRESCGASNRPEGPDRRSGGVA